jgi:serine protease Do
MISTLSRPTRGFAIVAIVALTLTSAGQLRAESEEAKKSSEKVLSAFRPVVARPSESTVRVRSDGKDVAMGTIVGADGLIVTKASELKGTVICKLKDGREMEAKVLGIDDKYDLAMLKVEAKDLKPIEWKVSKAAEVGNWVASPGLSDDPIAVGVVSVATRENKEKTRFTPNPKSGFLGIALPQGPDDLTPRIEEVIPDTAAAKAKLEKGDIILTIDGEMIKDAPSVPKKLGKYKPNEVVTIRVKRGSEEKEFKITLGKRPADRTDVQNHMGGELSDRRTGFPTFLQHDTVLKPSDCGGPLVDLEGKAVGINIARAGRVESYAVPAEVVQKLIPDFVSGKLAPSIVEKIKEIKDSIVHFEEERAAVEKKIAEALKEKTELDKKLAQARDALKKAEADSSTKTSKDDKQAPEK